MVEEAEVLVAGVAEEVWAEAVLAAPGVEEEEEEEGAAEAVEAAALEEPGVEEAWEAQEEAPSPATPQSEGWRRATS